ncbi:MAG: RNA polymerase sigma factor [Flavobacteriales bacterium]|nr:RNA polymerase sigma factor [Flavobacteriales bacterium]
MNTDQYNQSVDMFADNVFRFIIKNLKNEEKAKDVVQDAYLKLWERVDDVSFEKVKSWLFSTAYRLMIDGIRRDKKQGGLDQVKESRLGIMSQYTDLNEKLHEALDTLPNDQKSVILLRDYEGYSYDEIAEITELSLSQVKVYIYRGRIALKKYIGTIEALI